MPHGRVQIYQTGTGNMSANNWSCGETTTGPVTQYVQTITTTDSGAITVTTTTNGALGAVNSTTVRLTPVNSSGTALTYSAPSSVQVSGFKCTRVRCLRSSCRVLPLIERV